MLALGSGRGSQSGKLIALEGHVDIISTQLRLLPASRKILIVPSLQEYLSEEQGKDFNARSFVQHVHTAYKQRIDKARSFLQDSTDSHPKLVFTNGGSVSARTICISKISEHITNGEMAAAELLFNEIVKDGIVGLMRMDSKKVMTDREVKKPAGEACYERLVTEVEEDPTVKAMKAAETLDRETAALQTEDGAGHPLFMCHNFESDTKKTEMTDKKEEMAIFQGFPKYPTFRSSTFGSQGEIVETVLTIPEKKKVFNAQQTRVSPQTIRQSSPTVNGDPEHEPLAEPLSPVLIGKAQVAEVVSATEDRFLRWAQSTDELHLKRRQGDSNELESEGIRSLRRTASHDILRRKDRLIGERRRSDTEAFPGVPRYPFLRATQTTIKKSSTAVAAKSFLSSPSPQCQSCRVFVDRGTDAEKMTGVDSETQPTDPFFPVFDIVEDTVIQFSDKISHGEIFESVIRSYKDGSYPVFPERFTESTPVLADDFMNQRLMSYGPETIDIATNGPELRHVRERRGSYDPFTAHEYTIDMSRSRDSLQLTPPITNQISEKFLIFSPVGLSNPIDIQNAFRQFLKSKFPVDGIYSQSHHVIAPEGDCNWKPVFRNGESSNIGIEGSNVDLIIALGSEDGVSKDMSLQISGRIERLGMKKNGLNRSGKLDIRYLIHNAVQTFSACNSHPTLNPLTNPSLLAPLLVPQLESYLTLNSGTRLLVLQYPAAHLPTVFALRELLGPNLIRIAGIVDSLASDPPSYSRPRTPNSPSSPNPLSNDAVASRHARLNSRQRSEISTVLANGLSSPSSRSIRNTSKISINPSFSKADFVLPSTATEIEISTFLSSICKYLIEKSSFYTPEPENEAKPIETSPEKPALPPTPPHASTSPNSQRQRNPRIKDHPPLSHSQKRENKIFKLTGKAPGYVNGHTRDHSNSLSEKTYAESVMTTVSERDRKWENFYIGEEDSEDDDWDRMILGRAGMKRFVPEESMLDEEGSESVNGSGTKGWRGGGGPLGGTNVRGNLSKKKALKWLGLA